jgi:hypothetical protein
MSLPRSTRALLGIALGLGALYLVAFYVQAFIRLGWPFEIEWMEGGMLTHAARVLDGEAIYAKPSADFVPFFYTPLYPLLLAGLSRIGEALGLGGLGFPMARAVSLLATTGIFAFLFQVGRREAGRRYGVLAVGLYAALFRTNGAFYDLARPDSMFLALLCLGIYLVYYKRTWPWVLVAALVFVVGYFTKQLVSVFAVACTLYLLWRDWRHGLLFAGTVFVLGALATAYATHATDGWFWTFIFEGHQGHLFYWKNILMEYWRDVLFLAPLLLLLPLLWFGYKVPVAALSVFLVAHWSYAYVFRARTLDYVPHMYYRELFYEDPRWAILIPPAVIFAMLAAYRARNPGRATPTHGFWLWLFVAGVGASGLNHSTQWAYSNCFMPLSIFASILIACGARDLIEGGSARWSALIPGAIVVQLVALAYSPVDQVPGEADWEALDTLNARLDRVEGPVFFPAHPFAAWQRDGKVHIHQMGITDVGFMGGVPDLPKRLRAGAYAAVVMNERSRVPGLESGYYHAERFRWPTRDALRTKTGFITRPIDLWLKQDAVDRSLADGLTANFERADWGGWTREGTAFADTPPRKKLRGGQGRRSARSDAGSVGALRSPPVKIAAPRLTALIGGKRDRRLAVRVLVEGREVAKVHAPGGEGRRAFKRVDLDLADHVGAEAVIEISDRSGRNGDWFEVDDLRWAD